MIKIQKVYKVFREGDRKLEILKGLDLEIPPGKKIGIVGASGSGKSTLLHILGGLDPPTKGEVSVEGKNLYSLSETERAKLRNRFFGFVFQFYHLLPELTVLENSALPAWIGGFSKREGLGMAEEALTRVGLKERLSFFPSRLSGGEQQRVALARALVLKPKVLLADEPTGNLDWETGQTVIDYLLEIVGEAKGSLVLVTHNVELAKGLDEILELKNGQLQKI